MARRNRPHRPLFARGAGVGFRAFVLSFLAIGIWFADQRSLPFLQQVRGALATVLHPLLVASASPVSLSNATEQFRSRQALAEENRLLKEAQLKLNAKLLTFEALSAENRRIRQLVASASALPEKVLIVEIIAVSQDPYRHQITLNKGENDGVYQGQALVDASGVMGQVVKVNPSTSTALLITDAGHGIPVEINRTGLQTIARGAGDGHALVLPFLPGNADVQVGDLLVTSGLGGRFPPGYPVGEVYDVKRGTAVHFMQATAAPTAKLYQGRQALLVWSERPEVPEADAAEPDVNVAPPTAGMAASTAAAAAAASAAKPATTVTATAKPGAARTAAAGAPATAPGTAPATPAAASPQPRRKPSTAALAEQASPAPAPAPASAAPAAAPPAATTPAPAKPAPQPVTTP